MKIKIATRKSELALFQANYVAEKLNQLGGVATELVPLLSEGDQTDKPLHEIGGKGLFVNKLESALILALPIIGRKTRKLKKILNHFQSVVV
jgi:hydroxymethylbilane synthase